MTTATVAPPDSGVGADVRVRPVGVVRSEWVRIRSLRSTWITMLVTVVIVLGLGAAITAARAAHWPPENPSEVLTFDPTAFSLAGTFLAQLAIGVLGVLVVTGEYATGMIRATFTAVPRRLHVLVARALVFAAAALVVLIPTALVAFFVGQSLLSSKHIDTTIGAPHVLRAVIGAALYLTAIGLLGMALGWLLRHTAGAIATLFGLLLIVPIVIHFLPDPWPDRILKWLPAQAGASVWSVRQESHSLGPWSGFGMLVLYVVAVSVVAAVLLRERDV